MGFNKVLIDMYMILVEVIIINFDFLEKFFICFVVIVICDKYIGIVKNNWLFLINRKIF